TTSTAIGSVKKLAEFKKNEIAAVAGCGAIGLAIIKTLKYLEAKNIIAIDIDNTLNKLGAIRIGERVEADLDYEDDFDGWIAEMKKLIG
ncbi:MAG: hypothetical protein CBC27_03740, partial [Opitutia bacterium TMED67]